MKIHSNFVLFFFVSTSKVRDRMAGGVREEKQANQA